MCIYMYFSKLLCSCVTEEPSLNGRIFYPPGFKSSNQYPVLMSVYGGPYSQQVSTDQSDWLG